MHQQTKSYFEEYQLGDLLLKNRIIMAPLTRQRCTYGKEIANELLVQYYSMRSDFGLIFSEAIAVSQRGHCFPGAANLFTEEQKNGWKKVVDAVHQAGGKIIAQVFHGGRAALPGEEVKLAPSAVPIFGTNRLTGKPFETPKEMTIDDIELVMSEFKHCIRLAKEANFDGVSIHAANGYLVDQFLRDGTNKRIDQYGGSIANRCRFCLQLIDIAIEVFGKGRVGIRISPTGRVKDMYDSDPIATFSYLLSKLEQKGIAYVEIKEAGTVYHIDELNEKQKQAQYKTPQEQCPDLAKALRNSFCGTIINNDGFDYQKGIDKINAGYCDLVSFGKKALSNPDLVYRFKNNLPLNDWDGDYPTYEQQQKQKSYFDQYIMKDLVLKNRIIMAPLVRRRCDYTSSIPNDLMAEYYSQRAEFGLIFTEATAISQRAHAYRGSACLYNEAQKMGWKKVVDAVHAKDGKIFIQLFHAGKIADPDVNGGFEIFSSSPMKINEINNQTNQNYKMPKEMNIEEIKGVIQQFKESAILAKEAGFDGVQLHGANGYLVEDFLNDGTNKRTDQYGGSIENRCKFCLEIIDSLIEVFGNKRVGIRISPNSRRFAEMHDSDPVALYKYLLQQLEKKGIAFVEVKECDQFCNTSYHEQMQQDQSVSEKFNQLKDCCQALRSAFTGTIINNNGFGYQSGLERIKSGVCDLISFGRLAISNPDLVERFKNNWEVSPIDNENLFTNGAKGYTDYPTYQQLQEQKEQRQEKDQQQEQQQQ